MSVIFEDLPPGRSTSSTRWNVLLEELKVRPGEWARIAEMKSSRSAVGWLRRRVNPGRFEFAARNTFVYARYLGDDDE